MLTPEKFIFYKAVRMSSQRFTALLTAASLAMLAQMLEGTVRSVRDAVRGGGDLVPGLVSYFDNQIEAAVKMAASQNMVLRFGIPAITAGLVLGIGIRMNMSLATRGLY